MATCSFLCSLKHFDNRTNRVLAFLLVRFLQFFKLLVHFIKIYILQLLLKRSNAFLLQ